MDDVTLPGMLYGATVRSPVPRGIIRDIELRARRSRGTSSRSSPPPTFLANRVALIVDDQPYLATTASIIPKSRSCCWRIPIGHLLEEARRHVTIDIDPLPAVSRRSTRRWPRATVIWGDGQHLQVVPRVARRRGRGVVAAARTIVEGEYETGAQEQLYIEPNGMLAIADPESRRHRLGFDAVPVLRPQGAGRAVRLPRRQDPRRPDGNRRRVRRQGRVSVGHRRARRAARVEVRPPGEDHLRPRRGHGRRRRNGIRRGRAIGPPSIADGRLLAMDIDFVIDGGAYCTLSPVVLSRGTIHAAGPYFCPNVRVRGRAVATNAPPHGAFRGFGAPQSIFALERQMDRVAAAAGLSPDEFRRRNFIKPGQTTRSVR